MRQKTKSKKFEKNKVFKKALAFFCFFIFAFSLLNLNLASLDFSNSDSTFSIANETSAQETTITELDPTDGSSNNPLVWALNWILYGFFCFLALLLKFAGLLFDWAIDANNIRDVIHRQAIYDAWKMVRDFLNLGFILILLYSAFCTIFQIEKYHLKKILLMLVLMALLVNFSFPISRFIVDASNVTMYYFLNSAFNQEETKSFSAGLTGPTGIADVLVPRESDGDFDSGGSTAQIMMAIFFIFCLMITMFVIAAIFVIRIVALAVLIIFSSIGFVAAVFPDTKSFANQWWSNLFKYAFTGPILVFMMLIAYNLMREMAAEGTKESMKQYAQNYGHNPSLLANAAYFFIPIVILWMGIIATQKMGIAGADWTVKKATGARDWFAKIPQRTAIATGVPGGVKQAHKYYKEKGLPGRLGKVWGLRGTEKREESEARFAERFGVKGAKEQQVKTKAAQYKKDNISESDLKNRTITGDHAAALRLAEDGNMDSSTYTSLQRHLRKPKDKPMKDLIDRKVRQNNTEAIVKYRIDTETAGLAGAARIAAEDNIVNEEYGKLNVDSWKKQKKLYEALDPTSTNAGDLAIQRTANVRFRDLKPSARIEIAKNATGRELNRMRGANFPV